jgi:hypothetical protein
MFSNRDAVYNDISAPGDELFSTLPRSLTGQRPTCLEQGYSDCGPQEFRRPQGTSFATAIVSAGAALVRSTWPKLRADQVVAMLEGSAADQTADTGCRRCTEGRDALTGWGRLDIAAAVGWTNGQPNRDRFEPNDDAGARSKRLRKRRATIRATINYWDDANDVYAVHLKRRQLLRMSLFGQEGTEITLVIWKPGTRRLDDVRYPNSRWVAKSDLPGSHDKLRFRAQRSGRYFVQVKITQPGSGPYKLQLFR